MTDSIRAALDRLHEYAICHPEHDTDQLVARARAALTQPKPAGEVITYAELNDLCADHSFVVDEGGVDCLHGVVEAAIALALSRRAPVQPAEGEVAELVGAIEAEARKERNSGHLHSLTANELARIAALLQHRQPPQPVAVSERLPGPEDCAPWPGDPEAIPWCWFGRLIKDDQDRYFHWIQCQPGYGISYKYTHWLPHNALPLPSPEAP